MGGELGNETCIDRLLVSLELSPPDFILIENDNFYTCLASKSRCFGAFAEISARSSRKKKVIIFHVFFLRTAVVSGLVLPSIVAQREQEEDRS